MKYILIFLLFFSSSLFAMTQRVNELRNRFRRNNPKPRCTSCDTWKDKNNSNHPFIRELQELNRKSEASCDDCLAVAAGCMPFCCIGIAAVLKNYTKID